MRSNGSPFQLRMFAVVVVGALARPASARADDFALLRNTKNTTAAVTKDDVRRIFIGQKKTWPSGGIVQVVLPSVDSASMKWLASTLGVSEKDLMNKIKQEVFRGEMRKPIIVDSDGAGIEAVKNEPGAIYPAPSNLAGGATAKLDVAG